MKNGRGERMTNEQLVSEIQNGRDTTNNLERLYVGNERLIRLIISKIPHNEQDDDDYMQVAYIGLYKAAYKYDPKAGTRFMSYADLWIKREIEKYQRNDNGTLKRIPEYIQNGIFKIKKYSSNYEAQYGHPPTKTDIAENLKMTVKEIDRCLKCSRESRNISLDTPLTKGEEGTIAEKIPDYRNTVENFIEESARKQSNEEIWECVNDLPKDEAETIKEYYGENLCFREIEQKTGKPLNEIRASHDRGIRKLYRKASIKRAAKVYGIYSRAMRGSLKNFRKTGTSSTEAAAIELSEL